MHTFSADPERILPGRTHGFSFASSLMNGVAPRADTLSAVTDVSALAYGQLGPQRIVCHEGFTAASN